MDGHLKGVRVIDLTAYLSGPFVSMNLAAMGAEVIKIERPKVGDPCRWNPPFAGPEGVSHENKTQNDLSLLYLKRNRCKKSVFLNLQDDRGKDLLRRLIEKGDILLENFAPGSMERLGFDYKSCLAINPRIIYCSISGYGQDGPVPGPDRLRPDHPGHKRHHGRNGVPGRPAYPLRSLDRGHDPSHVRVERHTGGFVFQGKNGRR